MPVISKTAGSNARCSSKAVRLVTLSTLIARLAVLFNWTVNVEGSTRTVAAPWAKAGALATDATRTITTDQTRITNQLRDMENSIFEAVYIERFISALP